MSLKAIIAVVLGVGPALGIAQAWASGPPSVRRLGAGGAIGGAVSGVALALLALAWSPHLPLSIRLVAVPASLASFGFGLGAAVAGLRRLTRIGRSHPDAEGV